MMDLGIQGMRVLVTAGASGIGLEIARAFVDEGAFVHVCDVDESALKSVALSDPKISVSLAPLGPSPLAGVD
jgi:NAD(P)-dependent dehydrogenase (short-subunit alcohol dehydrogenase family)